MKRLIVPLLLLLALFPARAMAQEEPEPFAAEVVRDGDAWRATFHIPGKAPVWAFSRSALQRISGTSWRPDSWTVLTPGVTLERIGRFDALVAEGGAMPATVEIAFTPLAVDLVADYDPAIILSNGSLAIYTGHFGAFPVASRAELEAMPGPGSYPERVSLRDEGGEVLHRGTRYRSATLSGGGYVIFGDVEVIESEHVATILDPGLPQWLADGMGAFADEAFTFYTDRLGDHAESRPVILASWAGPTPEIISLGGSVAGNMIGMRLEGAGLVDPVPQALERAQWFVAHEGAHFWLGQTIGYRDRRDMWITEGGADLLAMRLMERQELSEGSDMLALVDKAREDCAALLPNGGIWSADDRGDNRAYYACGMLFALAVDRAGAARGEDFFTFVTGLIAAQPEGKVGADEWLDAAADFGLSQEMLALMRVLLEEGSNDGQGAVARLLGQNA
ncbi:hypothetical protein [Alteraurantiacibacter aquimixticola]|uniref:Peptidase M1 membrane alanine aminopeptidase domain-containing protein n=1 Tax=Alteraurantiacibacter aquimixticola TaxID=2489173 RepID=A0A4T3F414_9SPHN|nr:hypothetical protein [Alteraurantiacibacter aquimixticola]TIX49443.1 hypothetical protein E5222_11345 [Alteraurantiacibacter aquimixticola]